MLLFRLVQRMFWIKIGAELLDAPLDIKNQRDRYSRREFDLFGHDADDFWWDREGIKVSRLMEDWRRAEGERSWGGGVKSSPLGNRLASDAVRRQKWVRWSVHTIFGERGRRRNRFCKWLYYKFRVHGMTNTNGVSAKISWCGLCSEIF